MKPLLLHVTADADEAADSLASHLQRSYNNGFSDGHGEAQIQWGDDS